MSVRGILRRWYRRAGGAVSGRRREQELADEFALHIEMQIEDNLRLGMNPQEARRSARLKFGSLDAAKENYRDQRGLPWAETLRQDVRYALRGMCKAPGFTAVAVATLALGIGANSAIFSVVESVILRGLPYPHSERLVSLFEVVDGQEPEFMNSTGGYIGSAVEPNRTTVSVADLMDFRRETRGFEGIAGLERYAMNMTGRGAPQRVWGERVTANYFAVVGVLPEVGRAFADQDDREGAEPVAILTHQFSEERFGGETEALGATALFDGRPYRVIGVMPKSYQPPSQFASTETLQFFVPAAYSERLLTEHGEHDVMAVARLRPSAGIARARAELETVSRRLARAYPKTNSTIRAAVRPLADDISEGARMPLAVLLGAVGMILLIACANLANLLLARAVGRKRETTVRFALGASRARVVSAMLTGSLLLALFGGFAGLLVGVLARRALVALAPANIPRLHAAGLDGAVLLFTAALSLGTGLLFGLFPAWQSSNVRLSESLRAGERGMAGRSVMRWRGALTVSQVALSMVLLVGSGLLIRSLVALNSVNLGFQTEHVMALRLDLPEMEYGAPGRRLRFFEELTERVRALPGVESAAFANRMPMRGGWSSSFFLESACGVQGHGENPSPGFQAVSPRYFDTLGIPLLRGRVFNQYDRDGAPLVAVVNAQFMRRYGRDGDLLGRRIRSRDTDPWAAIVGVVGDIRRGGKSEDIWPQVYLPAAQTQLYRTRLGDFAFRGVGNPRSLLAVVQKEVWTIDKDQPLTNAQTLDEILWSNTASRRFQTALLTLFAGLALVLTVVGIYGVIAYSVGQRTAEIGIRVALGATQREVLGMIFAQCMRLVACGVGAGIVGAYGLSRYLATLLFSIQPTDPVTYAATACLVTLAAAAACYVPARRSIRIDPSRALRYE